MQAQAQAVVRSATGAQLRPQKGLSSCKSEGQGLRLSTWWSLPPQPQVLAPFHHHRPAGPLRQTTPSACLVPVSQPLSQTNQQSRPRTADTAGRRGFSWHHLAVLTAGKWAVETPHSRGVGAVLQAKPNRREVLCYVDSPSSKRRQACGERPSVWPPSGAWSSLSTSAPVSIAVRMGRPPWSWPGGHLGAPRTEGVFAFWSAVFAPLQFPLICFVSQKTGSPAAWCRPVAWRRGQEVFHLECCSGKSRL